jgi:hypothetical protein
MVELVALPSAVTEAGSTVVIMRPVVFLNSITQESTLAVLSGLLTGLHIPVVIFPIIADAAVVRVWPTGSKIQGPRSPCHTPRISLQDGLSIRSKEFPKKK